MRDSGTTARNNSPRIFRPNFQSTPPPPQLPDFSDKKANASVQMAGKINSHRPLAALEQIHEYLSLAVSQFPALPNVTFFN